MYVKRKFLILLASLLLAAGMTALGYAALARPSGAVSGIVVDEYGEPVGGAVVRQRTTENFTHTAADGTFSLGGLPEGITTTVTAWAEWFYPGGGEVLPPASGFTITLRYHPAGDNPDHAWLTSYADPDDPIGCGHCMVANLTWESNAHAGAGTNPRFFSLYNGTDLTGTLAVAPGYLLDFPGTAGNCAACHAPAAAAENPYATDMNALGQVESQGVFCDFCHKIGAVYLNPVTGLPYPNMPGVVSYRLFRPPADTHMFFGPFDDVLRRVSYSNLEKKSQFCAGCHQFSFWGQEVYGSFKEWLESAYPAQGVECQSCHMKPGEVDYFVFPENGGLIRIPELIASHTQPGAADIDLLQNTVTMDVEVSQDPGWIDVRVTITNTDAGHHVPTDFPGRNLILTVSAAGENGVPLSQIGGPVVPDWGGQQAGSPGQGFARLLRDALTGEFPVVSYWKQTLVESDNRIPAMESDVSAYRFAAPLNGGEVNIQVRLIFRRIFSEIAAGKGWQDGDITMESYASSVSLPPSHRIFLPVVSR